MLETRYTDELKKARNVQEQCKQLHLPIPPVVTWEAKIENDLHIFSKSNSYVRNALNSLAYNVGLSPFNSFVSTSFGDGVLSFKNTNGSITSIISRNATANGNPILFISGDSSVETLDSFQATSLINPIQAIAFTSTTFEGGILYTTISNQFINSGTSELIVNSAGVTLTATGGTYLFIRDVFAPIVIPPGKTLSFKYTTEILY